MTEGKFTLSTKQQLFLTKVREGGNVFLTGKAGTGKSFIVKNAIEMFKEQKKKVVALAPTGVAANNIGGQTLHSFFNLNPYGVLQFDSCNFLKTDKKRLIDSLDVIFIDEVSMLRADLFDAINWTLIKNGCKSIKEIQFVLIGDMKQLPPPIDDNFRSVMLQTYEGVEFNYSALHTHLSFETIELDEILRQSDNDFILALNAIREGGKHEYFRQFANRPSAGIVLAPHNATVAKYNHEGLRKQEGKQYTFTAIIEGNLKADDFNLESEIKVKHGCKIMYLVNSKNNNLVNGTLGIFIVKYPDTKDEKYFIDVKGIEYEIEKVSIAKKEYVLNRKENKLELVELGKITQYPIKLAYALSIHKSQGLTFEQVTIDLSRPCFQKGQMYVALSRVTTPDGLSIITN